MLFTIFSMQFQDLKKTKELLIAIASEKYEAFLCRVGLELPPVGM